MRFPSVWLPANGKRYLNARVSGSAGSAAMAARHLRTSPGGVTFASSRSTPVEPPSSAIATTAAVSRPMDRSVRMDTGAPVPPPMTTARRCSPGPTTGGVEPSAAKAAVAEGSWVNAGFAMGAPYACGAATGPSGAGAGGCGAAAGSGPGAAACGSAARRPSAPSASARSRWAMLTR